MQGIPIVKHFAIRESIISFSSSWTRVDVLYGALVEHIKRITLAISPGT